MHRVEPTAAARRWRDMGLSLVAALSAAVVVVSSVSVASGSDVTVVVPNAFTCSRPSDVCRQINPPYSPSAPSQCTWTSTAIPSGMPANRVC